MFTLVAISKVLSSALGIALLFSQPGFSTPRPNAQIDDPFTQTLALSRRGSTSHPSPNLTPNFTHIYTVAATLEAEDNIPGPFGARILHGFLG